ncbi:MAG: hypothetical protein IJH71_02495 [Eubacterium sp.]|nr:hypothetical protein [Eubacterium sp.]
MINERKARREIKLKIHEESDLFSVYDPDESKLSEDVMSYFKRNYINLHRRTNEEYTIRIISDTPVNEEHVRECIRNEFLQEKDDIGFGVRKLTLKEICFGVIGVLITALWMYLSYKYKNLGVEIISVIAYVSVWEAVSIASMERPELRRIQKNLLKLANAEIIIDVKE